MFDGPLYGDERDHFIGQAKAVLNLHFYDSEPLRAGARVALPVARHAGDLRARRGEPAAAGVRRLCAVAAARCDRCVLPRRVQERAVAQRAQQCGRQRSAAPTRSRRMATCWRSRSASAARTTSGGRRRRGGPTRIHIGSGKDYKPGWLNVDVLSRAEPDLVLDLSQPQAWPLLRDGADRGPGGTRRRPGRSDRRQQRARARGRPAAPDDTSAAAAARGRQAGDRGAVRTLRPPRGRTRRTCVR